MNQKQNRNKQKVAFYTLGCKVNQYETNSMIQQFQQKGYELVEFDKKADIYVINTCTVTNMSDRKSRQMLRRAKQENPQAIIVAVGCYAQVAKEELEKLEELDIILGTNEKQEIVTYVEQYQKEKQRHTEKLEEISDVMMQKEFIDFGTTTYTNTSRVSIKIQEGCDRFCSYCIIPYARGRIRSRTKESIIEEIKALAKQGIKEVVLTGIHIASYGRDFHNPHALIELLEQMDTIQGIERVRLGSLEPTLMSEEFVLRLKKLTKLCNHFHLSLQSGCDDTLKRMNRTYTTEEFRQVVERLRKYIPEVMLTTDIIVGFPQETETEFLTTYQFLEEMKFYKMHIFKYSPRKGTKAEKMKGQIDGMVKEKRSARLIELSNKNQKKYHEQWIGKQAFVLFEEVEGEYRKGHTTNYMMVKAKILSKDHIETIQKVEIIEQNGMDLMGKEIEESKR